MEKLPNDINILVSYLNTMLRDKYKNLNELIEDKNIDKEKLLQKLKDNNYTYNKRTNQIR